MLTRGKLAKQCGVGRETIRYYEGRGLLSASRRTAAGYRLFDEAAVSRLRFVRNAQDLGFTLAEIAELLSLRDLPATTCPEVRAKAAAKIKRVRESIHELLAIEQVLERLLERCPNSDDRSACPILNRLEGKETNNA